MNRNGVIGEPSDCRVCAASLAGGKIVAGAVDPDGDGVNEDLIYVDSGPDGRDGPGCGSAGSAPCRTLGHALKVVADGPGDGAEDILCIKGTHVVTSTMELVSGGVAGSYAADLYPGDKARWGSSKSGRFEYPKDPLMILGWDADGDGQYPPHDTDDRAILTGDQGNGSYSALAVFSYGADFTEIAHLRVEDIGRDDKTNVTSGFARLLAGTSHAYIHDNEFSYINGNGGHAPSHIWMSTYVADGSSWIAVINNSFENMGGYGFRGSCGGCTDFRVDYNSATMLSTSDPSAYGGLNVTFYRNWDSMTRVSVSHNDIDLQPDRWNAFGNLGGVGIAASICVQDFWAEGNVIREARAPLYVRLTSTRGECQSRPTTLAFRSNRMYLTHPGFSNARGVMVESGNYPRIYLEEAIFENNSYRQSVGPSESPNCMLLWGGNNSTDFDGRYHVVKNTCEGDFGRSCFEFGSDLKSHHADVVFKSNVCSSSARALNVDWSSLDAVLSSDFNVFSQGSGYRFGDQRLSELSEWRAISGQDSSSWERAPSSDR